MTPSERIAAKIASNTDKSFKDKLDDYTSYEEWVDDLSPILNMLENIEKASGQKIPNIRKPYEEFRSYKGKNDLTKLFIKPDGKDTELALEALRNRYPNIEGLKNFKTIAQIITEAGGRKNQKDFSAYCAAVFVKEIHSANHEIEEQQKEMKDEISKLESQLDNAKTSMARKRINKQLKKLEKELKELTTYETPFTESDCDAKIAEGKSKYDQAQKDLAHYSKTMLEILYRAGLFSDKQYNDLMDKWQNYVPLFRVFDENEDLGFGDSFKKMKGSKRDIIDPLASILHNTFHAIGRAEKNLVINHLAQMARCGGAGKIAEVVEGSQPNAKKTVTFKQNGKKMHIEFEDESVVRAINSIDNSSSASAVVKLLNLANRVYRWLLTAGNWDFAAGNISRDLPDAYIHNKYSKYGNVNPARAFMLFADVLKGIHSRVFKTKDYYEWLAHGGGQATMIAQDIDTASNVIEDINKSEYEKWLKSGVKGFGKQIINTMQYLSDVTEAGTRIAVYKQAKKALASQRSDGKATFEDKRKAAFESRDIIDFAKSGRSTREISKGITFFNAAIQGLDKFCRTFNPKQFKTEEGRKAIFGAIQRMIFAGVAPAMLLFFVNRDKDWWKNAPDWLKEQNWLISEHIKIPKGMDFSIRFASMATEQILDKLYNNKEFSNDRFFETIGGAFPSITSNIFTPFIENCANYSFFKKAPIVNRSYEHLPAHMQYDAYTSSIAKDIGEIIGFSPMKIDNLIYGWTGTLGRIALQSKPLGWTLDDMPMVRRFYYDPIRNSREVKDYYNALDKQTEYYEDYRDRVKREGGKAQKPEGFDPALYQRLKTATKYMADFSKREKAIIDDPKLSAERRNDLINKNVFRR